MKSSRCRLTQVRGNPYRGVCQAIYIQLTGDSGQGEDIVVIVPGLVRLKLLVACPNQVVASVIDQQIVFEYRLCVMNGQPRGKTAVCSLDVAVAIVYPDDLHALMVFHRLHSSFLFACPNLRWSSRSFTSLPLGGGLSSTSYLSPRPAMILSLIHI